MKKLMILMLLVLGMYQTTTPMFGAVRAAFAARMNHSVIQYVVAPTIFGALGAVMGNLPQCNELEAMNKVFSNPRFQENNGMVEHGLLRRAWETSKWLYSEFGAGIGIAGMLMGSANAAHSLVRNDVKKEQQQIIASSDSPAVSGASSQITKEMREAQHRRNRELLAKSGYNPLVIRANK